MGTFFQVVGVAAVIGIFVVCLGIFIIVYKIKKFFRTLAKGFVSTPQQIHLVQAREVSDFEWKDEAGLEKAAAGLPELGFKLIDDYAIPEMPHVRLRAFYNVNQSAFAIVYELEIKGLPGHHMEIVTRYEEGQETKAVSYSNHALAALMDKPEGFISVKQAGATTAELFKAFLAGRPAGRFLPVSPDVFVERFESAYAREMEWRNSRGGPTKEEIRRVADATGKDADEETIETAHKVLEFKSKADQSAG